MLKTNEDIAIAKGDLVQERQDTYDRRAKIYEKLRSYCSNLCVLLGAEMPDLPTSDESAQMGIGISIGKLKDDGDEFNYGIWEDEESRAFYDNLTDLAKIVPGILLGLKQVIPEDKSQTVGSEILDASKVETSKNADEEDEAVANEESQTTKVGLDAILVRLPNAVSKEIIDQIAVEFAYINRKTSRRRLSQALAGVSRQRIDLLPFYSRLIATLNPFMPDIGLSVIEELETSFRYHQRKKDQLFIEEKIKNIKYFAELAKFGVIKSHTIFHCLKVLLDSFNFHNIDLTCALLETCGRFLYRTPETNVRMVQFVCHILILD